MLVYERPDQKEWGFSGDVTDDGRYLIVSISHGTDPKNRVFYKDLQAPDAKVVELLNDFDAAYNFIDNDGPVFWFHTDLDAPRGRVIAIDTRAPERGRWKELIPQAAETIQGVSAVNQQFFVDYLQDAHTQVKVFDLAGRLVREVQLPGLGSAGGFRGKRTDTETFYSFTSFTHAGGDLPLRRHDRDQHRLPRAEGRVQPGRLRNPSRCSTRARTARACRCSSRTRKG